MQTLKKIMICLNNFFLSNQYNGTNINKNCFSPQSVPHTVKLFFSVVLKFLGGNFEEISLFIQKSDYLRKEY